MPRILLVEDHELLHPLLSEAIQRAGHDVQVVKTKREAEEALSANRFDLVVCDVLLPDGSGDDVARRAVEMGMKVMLMSGHPEQISTLISRRVAHLQKPFRIETFLKSLTDHLRD